MERWSSPEAYSSDSGPDPGPSDVSHVSQRPLDTEGHRSKRKQEKGAKMKENSSGKKSRSKSPTRRKTRSSRRLSKARRRKLRPDHSTDSSSEEEVSETDCRLHTPGYTPTDFDKEEKKIVRIRRTFPRNPESHAAFSSKYLMQRSLSYGEFGKICIGIRLHDSLSVVLKYIPINKVKFTELKVNRTMTYFPLEVFLLMRVGAGPDNVDESSVAPRLLDWYDLGPEVVLVIERPQPCVDLLDYIQDRNPKGLRVAVARIIFRQLVEAAIEMEAKGVFHRDIKLENVLIEKNVLRARFIDFSSGVTCTPGQMFYGPLGTLQYSSPESLRCQTYTSTSATAWQLGLTLFGMLFNKKPLINERTMGSMRRVPIPRSVSKECRDLLRGCLAMKPEKRLSLEEIRSHPWFSSD